MKNAHFCVSVKSVIFLWILTLLLSFMKVFRVLSTAFLRSWLFATCHTSALSRWHVFTVLLTYIPPHYVNPLVCHSTDFLVCINTAPRNNSCGACELSANFSNSIFSEIWHILKTLSWNRIFSRELGWSLTIRYDSVYHTLNGSSVSVNGHLQFIWE